MKFIYFFFSIFIANLFFYEAFADENPVVIVNQETPVDKIDQNQVTQIFLRQTQTWSNGKTIQPIDLKEGSSLKTDFYSKVTGRSPAQLRAYWARQSFTGMGIPPKEVSTTEEMNKMIENTPGAIGYINKTEIRKSNKIIFESE